MNRKKNNSKSHAAGKNSYGNNRSHYQNTGCSVFFIEKGIGQAKNKIAYQITNAAAGFIHMEKYILELKVITVALKGYAEQVVLQRLHCQY